MAGSQGAGAVSFELDSIAKWGTFPKFCVNVYRWGDRFFNPFDTTYVQGSGRRWNVKTVADVRTDSYNFILNDGFRINMLSHPSTQWGFYLTYMAVTVGYDFNLSNVFGSGTKARKRWDYQFNCSLFTVQYYYITNDVGTTINSMGPKGDVRNTRIDFNGLNNNVWGLDFYYFFNHKKYSQGAAFNYGKIQVKSQGSWFAGLSFGGQRYNFDFSSLVEQIHGQLPEHWNYHYSIHNKDYFIKVGYGYNWVFHPGWCLGVSEAPVFGLRRGTINSPQKEKYTFGFTNRLRTSLVYNHKKRWFYGLNVDWNFNVVRDKEHAFMASNASVEISAGYRFELFK